MSAPARVLLDTHALLWAIAVPDRLGDRAVELLEDPAVDALVSIASLWEMAIEASLGKLVLHVPLQELVERHVKGRGYHILEIGVAHVVAVQTLPWHHRDPFDRLLVSQAALEGLPIVSADAALDPYGVSRVW